MISNGKTKNSKIHNTYYTLLLEPDQISHIQSIVAKRGLTNRPYVKKLFKTQFWLQLDIVS